MPVKTILFCDNSLRELINFRIELINHFAALGYNVILVAPLNRQYKPLYPNIHLVPVELNRSGKNLIGEWKYFNTLRKIYKEKKPDYIIHYTIKPNIYGTIAAKLCGIDSSLMVAGLGYVFFKGGISNLIARWLYRLAFKLTRYVLVLNSSNKEYLIKSKMVLPEKIIHLEGGEGVNLNKFKPAPIQTANRKCVYLMIARLLYDKGYSEYVKAAEIMKQQFPNVEFQLLGDFDSSYPNHVPKDVVERDSLSGKINYLGYCSDVMQKVENATCIVLPSYYNEGLSRVLMEALAMGKVIITTNIAGCREMVEDGKNGFIVPIKNPVALVDAMKKVVMMDVNTLENIRMYNRQKAERVFNVENVIKVYDWLIQN